MAHDTGLIVTGLCVDDGSDRSLMVLFSRKANNAPMVVSGGLHLSQAPWIAPRHWCSVSKTLKQISPF